MNANLHYKLFKLTNGENIVCTTDDNCENLHKKVSICISDPVIVNPVRMPMGLKVIETYVMTPWINYAKENIFEIPTNHIILATDIHEKFKETYISFIEEKDAVKNETIKGEDRQRMLEHMLDNMTNPQETIQDETEEDNKKIHVRGNRSIH
ncbi:MAG: hypothetical protein EBU90_20890 [Proteobacteria bacterium]|nr:hypothetical protein [Pseudomonadota bacterium]NBP13412.1 hypothetical protein [bacterium]